MGVFLYYFRCQCPSGYNGPRCQQTARSFRGNGWAWYPALEMCDNSHLSFEFITRKSDGLLLYNGPIVPPEVDEIMVSGKIFIFFYTTNYTINNVLIIFFISTDFISVELERGIPRLLIDFGSGTLELKVKPKKTLDDGEWHRLDIFWNTEVKSILNKYYHSPLQFLVINMKQF